MPVTIIPAAHQPKAHPPIESVESRDRFLERSCPDSVVWKETHIYASSFSETATCNGDIYPSSSSFVRSAIEAWGRHSHLILRPEDMWFTILVQLNFFMKKNAESVRHLFVERTGAKTKLTGTGGDWTEIVRSFRKLSQEQIKAEWLSEWISPGFSTSTADDETTATVLMTGLMKTYFDYSGGVICGIPSVTLLGTKQDWQRLLKKIDRLEEFGAEPKAYAHRLRPILSRAVCTFEDSTGMKIKEFWDQMVHAKVMHARGCGVPPLQYIVSGWILGFFFWDHDGKVNRNFSEGYGRREPGSLKLDDVHYGQALLDDLPVGYAKAPFTGNVGGKPGGFDTPWQGYVLAGSIGKRIVDGAPDGYYAAVNTPVHTSPHAGSKEGARHEGCFSGLLRKLSCFKASEAKTGSQEVDAVRRVEDEKSATEAVTEKAEPGFGHSTIQPQSGWFLFGPDKDIGPFFDEEETWGPTVDAIDSCDGVERYNEWERYP